MAGLYIQASKCNLCLSCLAMCPFGALSKQNNKIEVDAGCKLCGLCAKHCERGAIRLEQAVRRENLISEWKDILVFCEHSALGIHPVVFELIGKALELAADSGQKVHLVLIGNGTEQSAKQLLHCGVSRLIVYDDDAYVHYTDAHAAAFEDAIQLLKPSIVLVGATPLGRSLAPLMATRFRSGLTADCTQLLINPNGDLVQIRPAFGGNIMARIVTPVTRPQFATVRYKVMKRAELDHAPDGSAERRIAAKYKPVLEVIKTERKQRSLNISDAEVLIAVGRGVKNPKDLEMMRVLADLLGAQLACSRPLIEAGWLPYTQQIGLSGRTVKPKLIITCGVSGAVQFTASMNTAECIIAVNSDKNAPIFKTAHYGMVGDLYEVIPRLIDGLKARRDS